MSQGFICFSCPHCKVNCRLCSPPPPWLRGKTAGFSYLVWIHSHPARLPPLCQGPAVQGLSPSDRVWGSATSPRLLHRFPILCCLDPLLLLRYTHTAGVWTWMSFILLICLFSFPSLVMLPVCHLLLHFHLLCLLYILLPIYALCPFSPSSVLLSQCAESINLHFRWPWAVRRIEFPVN